MDCFAKRAALVVMLFTLCYVSRGQDIQTLKSRLDTTKTDSSRVKTLARLGFQYAFIQLDSSRQYSQAALELAQKIGFRKGEADALNNMAISYDVAGQYEKALELYLEAKTLYQEINNLHGLANIYNNCGMVYESLGDTEKAIEYHSKSLALEEDMGDTLGVAYSQIHIANIHVSLKKYDDAMNYYTISKKSLERLGDSDGLAFVYLGVGELFLESDQPNEAIKQSEMAFQIFKELENKKGMAEASLITGKCYLRVEDYSKSRENLLLTLQLANQLDGEEITSNVLLTLVELYKKTRDFESALSIYEQYITLDRASRMDEMERNIKEMDARYNFEKKEQEILLLSSEKEFQKSLRNIFVSALVIILTVMGFLYRAYKLSMKRATMLRVKNQEIRAKNVEVRKERKNALKAAQAKSEFLSVMSHEIRTPMNAVIGSTHLLLQQNPKLDQLENLRTLKFSSDNLLLLINDILDLSKIESNKVELEKIPFDLQQLCKSIFSTHVSQVNKGKVNFVLDYAKDIPDKLLGDSGRLGQVLNNLISNAIKFTKEGVVKFRVSSRKNADSKVLICFEISDTGIGIPPEKMNLVFDSFSQADSDTTRKYGGTGLGLYITKKILELFGTYIKVESEVDKGSTFSFELELKKNLATGPVGESSNRLKVDALRGANVLVVDDDKTNLLIARGVLSRWGMNVVTVENGQQALDRFSKERFDVVLLDLRMPDMDGYEVTKAMRSISKSENSEVPIIALSANSMGESSEDAKRNGMNDYLSKPFDPNRLLDLLYHYIRPPIEVQNDFSENTLDRL